jgi:hypothetical protein
VAAVAVTRHAGRNCYLLEWKANNFAAIRTIAALGKEILNCILNLEFQKLYIQPFDQTFLNLIISKLYEIY